MNNETTKIILIGCGYWGKNWYKTIMNSKYSLNCVVDPSPQVELDNNIVWIDGKDKEKLKKEAEKCTHAIVSTQPVLQSNYVDELSKHLPQKNILVEKPCGLDSKTAHKFMNVYPGYIFLHDPIVKYIKDNISMIGDPLIYKTIRASMGPRIRIDVSITEDYLVHDLYVFSWLFGSTLDIVSSIKTQYLSNPIKDDTVFVLGKFGKMSISMFSSWVYPMKERMTLIIGTKGAFIWKNEELYFNETHYEDHWGLDNYEYKDKYGNHNYELIEKDSVKIELDKSKSNLELQLENFVQGNRLNVNLLDVWNMIDNINKKSK